MTFVETLRITEGLESESSRTLEPMSLQRGLNHTPDAARTPEPRNSNSRCRTVFLPKAEHGEVKQQSTCLLQGF